MPMKLPQVEPLATQHWDKALTKVIQDSEGAPIHVHQLMANNPKLLDAWWDFRNHSVEGGTLGKRTGELVILRVAVHMQAWYEWGSHVDRALMCGLSIDEINHVLSHPTLERWQPADAALLEAVDELVSHHCISEKLQIKLAKYFSTAQLMDLIAIQGMYVILACMIKSWGLALDPQVQERIAEHTSERDFIIAAARFKASL